MVDHVQRKEEEEAEMSGGREREAMSIIDRIEQLAFEMRAPNVYTPQIVQGCIALRAVVRRLTDTSSPPQLHAPSSDPQH
jgi:hypothetical protein